VKDHLVFTIPGTPDRCLSPNAQPHWGTKARATADARETAYYAVCGEEDGDPWPPPFRLDFEIGWEKGRKRMDDQNAKSILKATCDGIADALHVNDRHFVIGDVRQVRDPEGRGYVRVTIFPMENAT
jgi:hypothetical protein